MLLIQSSFNLLFTPGKTRTTLCPTKSNLILEHNPSKKSNDSTLENSQKRPINEKGLDVNAPTGHKSIIFPLSS